MSAQSDLSNNKIGDSTGDISFKFFLLVLLPFITLDL
jgi:hypothetical protein